MLQFIKLMALAISFKILFLHCDSIKILLSGSTGKKRVITDLVIYMGQLFIVNATALQVVECLFSVCANAKLKDTAGIVDYHYHVFHVPRQFYIVNNSCSITHDPRLRKHCITGG